MTLPNDLKLKLDRWIDMQDCPNTWDEESLRKGFKACYAEMQSGGYSDVLRMQEREKKLVEALKVICNWMIPDARKVQKARDTLKDLGIE